MSAKIGATASPATAWVSESTVTVLVPPGTPPTRASIACPRAWPQSLDKKRKPESFFSVFLSVVLTLAHTPRLPALAGVGKQLDVSVTLAEPGLQPVCACPCIHSYLIHSSIFLLVLSRIPVPCICCRRNLQLVGDDISDIPFVLRR